MQSADSGPVSITDRPATAEAQPGHGSGRGPGRGIRVDATGVSQRAGGQQTLSGISLTVRAGQLVAIAGSSGAGKTMLVETLAGLRRPAGGTVEYDGVDCHQNLAAVRTLLGYVPQDDIIHRELTVRRTLRYAARLRLPAGSRPAAVDAAVSRVLGVLGLTDRADIAVGSLSGGERKRVSIGVELLVAPRLFFLDEPTSGLDPATGAGLMRLLRRLADEGTTVVLTTHAAADLDMCDEVAFLARSGSLAFAGPPQQARAHFGAERLEDVYDLMEAGAGDDPAAGQDAMMARSPEGQPDIARAPRDGRELSPAARRPGAVRQLVLLSQRSLDILVHSKLTLAILAGSPAMVLAMFVVLFPPGGFSFAHPSPNGTLMTIFWIAFAGFFFGLSYGLPQICGEISVVRREHHAGVGLGCYLLSKLVVLMPLLALVDAVTLWLLRVLNRLPATSEAETASLFLTLVLASAAALALGLLTSAAVNGPSQAVVAMPMLCFPQVLFSGAFLPVPAMAAAGRLISYPMSNRWAFEALGHAAGLPRLWALGGSALGPPLLASYGPTFAHAAWIDWIILGGFTLALLAAGRVVLARKAAR
ncbi:MAG TPA: ATP-binding cassette domain-containing protein [Streptosporangiaceae bacterium]